MYIPDNHLTAGAIIIIAHTDTTHSKHTTFHCTRHMGLIIIRTIRLIYSTATNFYPSQNTNLNTSLERLQLTAKISKAIKEKPQGYNIIALRFAKLAGFQPVHTVGKAFSRATKRHTLVLKTGLHN